MLARNLLSQGFLIVMLKSLFRQLCGRHDDLVNRHGVCVSQITMDMFSLSYSQYVVSSFMNYHRVSNKIKTTDAISGATSVTSLC